MPDSPPFDEAAAHRWFAVEANNLAWDLVGTAGRSDADAERMLHAAHAACFHWLAVGTPLNHLRALVLLSAAGHAAGRADSAVAYGRQATALLAQVADATAFDRASAFAALAASLAGVAGFRNSEAGAALRQARDAAGRITDTDDRTAFSRFFPDITPTPGGPT